MMDVNNAFMQRDLKGEVFMKMPVIFHHLVRTKSALKEVTIWTLPSTQPMVYQVVFKAM